MWKELHQESPEDRTEDRKESFKTILEVTGCEIPQPAKRSFNRNQPNDPLPPPDPWNTIPE